MVVVLQKRLTTIAIEEEQFRMKKSAAIAQAWDDWAVSHAMDGRHSPKRQRTIGTQVNEEMIANGTQAVGGASCGNRKREDRPCHERQVVSANMGPPGEEADPGAEGSEPLPTTHGGADNLEYEAMNTGEHQGLVTAPEPDPHGCHGQEGNEPCEQVWSGAAGVCEEYGSALGPQQVPLPSESIVPAASFLDHSAAGVADVPATLCQSETAVEDPEGLPEGVPESVSEEK